MDEDARTTATGLHRYGSDYLEAFRIISDDRDELILANVRYFLLCHAIELLFKSFLRHNKTSIRRLIGFGHNLCRLIIACQNYNDFKLIGLSDKMIDAILLANENYSRKNFEYIKVGSKTLPCFSLLEEAATLLSGWLKLNIRN